MLERLADPLFLGGGDMGAVGGGGMAIGGMGGMSGGGMGGMGGGGMGGRGGVRYCETILLNHESIA